MDESLKILLQIATPFIVLMLSFFMKRIATSIDKLTNSITDLKLEVSQKTSQGEARGIAKNVCKTQILEHENKLHRTSQES